MAGILTGYGRKKMEPSGLDLLGASENDVMSGFTMTAPFDSFEEAQQKFEDLEATVRRLMASQTYSKDFEFDVSTPNVVTIKSRIQDESQESVPTLTIKREAPTRDTSNDAVNPTSTPVDENLPPEAKGKENIQVTVENLASNQAMIEMVETLMPKEGPLYINKCGNTEDVIEFVKVFGDRIRIPNNLLADPKKMEELKASVSKALQSNLGENFTKGKVEEMFYDPVPPTKHTKYAF